MKITQPNATQLQAPAQPIDNEELIADAFALAFPPRQSAIYSPDFSTLRFAREGGGPLVFGLEAEHSVGGIAGNTTVGKVSFYGEMTADGKSVAFIKLAKKSDSDALATKPAGEPKVTLPSQAPQVALPAESTLAQLDQQRFEEMPAPVVRAGLQKTIAADAFFATLNPKLQAQLASSVLSAGPRVPTSQVVQTFLEGLLDASKNASVSKIDFRQTSSSASIGLTFGTTSSNHQLVAAGSWQDGVYIVRVGDYSELGVPGLAVMRQKQATIPMPQELLDNGGKVVVVNQDGKELAAGTFEQSPV